MTANLQAGPARVRAGSGDGDAGHGPGRRAGRRRLVIAALATAQLALAPALAQAAAPGKADTSFGSGGTASAAAGVSFSATAVQSDSRVLAVGAITTQSGMSLVVERFTSAGQLDTSFGHGGATAGPQLTGQPSPDSLGRAVAIQPDGKIVVVGTATSSDGSGRNGIIVERFDANGALDTGFGSGGVVQVLTGSARGDGYGVAVQPDGKIIATGSSDATGSGGGPYPRVAVVRLNANGSLDSSFGTGGTAVIDLGPYSYAYGVALQGDGKIVIVGSQSPGLQVVNALIARLTSAGKLDSSFASGGAYAHQYAQGAGSSAFDAVAIQADGKILAGGSAFNGNNAANAILARFTSAGAPDTAYGSGGTVSTPSATNYSSSSAAQAPGIRGLLIAPNGDAVAAGTTANGVATYGALWAFKDTGAADGSFGSGGATVITSSTQGDLVSESGIAMAPDGSFLVAGDQMPYGGSATGTLSRFGGLGAPPQPKPQPQPQPQPKPTALKSTLRVGRSYSVRAIRRGIPARVSCNVGCQIRYVITVSAGEARKLHLRTHGRRPVTLVSASAKLGRPGSHTSDLRLSRQVLAAIQRLRRVGVSLQISVRPSAGGRTLVLRKTITIHR